MQRKFYVENYFGENAIAHVKMAIDNSEMLAKGWAHSHEGLCSCSCKSTDNARGKYVFSLSKCNLPKTKKNAEIIPPLYSVLKWVKYINLYF